MESPTATTVLLNTNERYCFAIAKSLSSDYLWIAEMFGNVFYIEWKKRKDLNAKSGGQLGLGNLNTLVANTVGAFNKENRFTPVEFRELRGGYDIYYGGIGIGTVVRRGALTGDILIEAVIIKKAGRHVDYVIDTQGTMIKRFVYRAVGNNEDYALKILCKEGVFATGVKQDSVKTKNGGGIGFKEVDAQKKTKGVTRVKSEHVMGWKPSIFISFTTLREGARNPKGDMFGSVLLQIDLKVLKDLGIPFVYFGGLEGKRMMLIELKGQKGASEQAIEDIARTKEVLIEGWVPPEAICQVSNGDKIVWSRPT